MKKKTGGLDTKKLPTNGNKAITEYTRATDAQYGRFMTESTDKFPDNMAAQTIVNLSAEFHRLRGHLPLDATDKHIQQANEHLWRRTGFLAMASKYNQLNRSRMDGLPDLHQS